MARLSLLIDVTKCSGCHNCFLACRDEYFDNDYPGYSAPQPLEGQYWMQIKEVERGTWPKPKLDYIPLPCQHCETAPCIDVAADGAVYRRKDGVVIIDPREGQGAEGHRQLLPVPGDLVERRAAAAAEVHHVRAHAGRRRAVPRCVEACPTGALLFGDLDDPKSEISQAMAALKTEDYHPEYKTAPLVKYVGIPKRFVVGEVVRKDDPGECAQGVRVTLEGDGVKLETQTDSYGDFEFEGLEKNKQLRLRVDLKGYASMIIDVDTQNDVDLGEIVLEPLK